MEHTQIIFLTLLILGIVNGEGGGRSYIAVGKPNAGKFNYGIEHDQHGHSQGHADPHGYGGFGAEGENGGHNAGSFGSHAATVGLKDGGYNNGFAQQSAGSLPGFAAPRGFQDGGYNNGFGDASYKGKYVAPSLRGPASGGDFGHTGAAYTSSAESPKSGSTAFGRSNSNYGMLQSGYHMPSYSQSYRTSVGQAYVAPNHGRYEDSRGFVGGFKGHGPNY